MTWSTPLCQYHALAAQSPTSQPAAKVQHTRYSNDWLTMFVPILTSQSSPQPAPQPTSHKSVTRSTGLLSPRVLRSQIRGSRVLKHQLQHKRVEQFVRKWCIDGQVHFTVKLAGYSSRHNTLVAASQLKWDLGSVVFQSLVRDMMYH